MPVRDSLKKRQRVNKIMFAATAVCAGVSILSLFCILGYIAYKGFSSLSWSFFTRLPKPVGETGGGIANSILGSVKIVGLASALGIPVGILGGVYLAEYGRGLAGFCIRYAADVLSGVPSIVIGIFAYALIVMPMKRFSALSASAALAAIMIPIVLRNTEEFVRLVPLSIREAGLALGIPRWRVILFIVIPTAGRGLITGALLAVSRIAGETAPLIFTAFGNRFWDNGLLEPMASLPHTIFTYAIAPYEDWHRQAWAAALILMGLVLAINAGARYFLKPSTGVSH
ncbi:MAG: phosphate ABC transporter permease PstA [Elusimicrobia bacterium]|nr:phosphate ABC transporter permease PstA [Elusimicrobiota bacterium]